MTRQSPKPPGLSRDLDVPRSVLGEAAALTSRKEPAIKGPGLRIGLDVRRVWTCPRCGKQVKTSGNVTSRQCFCAEDGAWMQLSEPPAPTGPGRLRTYPEDDPDTER